MNSGEYQSCYENCPDSKPYKPVLFVPAEKSKLADLAKHANNGASNVHALILQLAEAVKEVDDHYQSICGYLPDLKRCDEVKIVIGQISFLIGESLGPSDHVTKRYQERTGNIKI